LAIPLFLEKLQANTNTARRQSLQALEQALPVYGRATVTASAVILWEAINLEVSALSPSHFYRRLTKRPQIFHATEADVEEMALHALKALLQTVYAEAESQEDISQDKASKLAQKLCDTCLLELKEADKSNATPATKILSAAVSASGQCTISPSRSANRLTDIPCDRLAGGVHRTTDIRTDTQ
jgi:DNA repair/transcription protein MET18/MMS19